MSHNNISEQPAKVATDIIPFPGKLARHRRAIAKKTGLQGFNPAVRQALRRLRELALRCRRPSRRVFAGGGASTQAQGYPIRRLAA